MYPYDRALKFAKDIKKLGINEQGKSFLDQFRILITEIGKFKVIWYSFFYYYIILLLYGFYITSLSLNWVLLPVITIYMGFNNHHPLLPLIPTLLLLLLILILPLLIPPLTLLLLLLQQAMLWDMFVWFDLLVCTTAVRRLSTYRTSKI